MAKRVLVIDDDPSVITYVTAVLTENGYETDAAVNGAEGMAKVPEVRPDLIILDVMMPKRSGLVMFKQLKKSDELKDIPVLMLSGVSEVIAELESQKEDTHERPYDSLRESLKAKIQEMRLDGEVRPDMFVDKPVDADVLIDKVRGLIGS